MAIFSAKVIGIIAASVIGVGVIATGVGVGLTRNNSTVIENETEDNKGNNLQKDESTKEEENPLTNTELDATIAINSISLTDFVFSDVTNHSDMYAFNVKEVSLSENKTKELKDKGIEAKVVLSNKNSARNLNEGKLSLEVTTYKSNKKELLKKLEDEESSAEVLKDTKSIAKKDFDLNDFKAADNDLVKLLNTTDKSTLDLLKVKNDDQSSDVYKTLDELNTKSNTKRSNELIENGLTKLLRMQKGTTSSVDPTTKDVFVSGIASLMKIETSTDGEQKAIFYLSSLDKNNPLKLVKKDGKDTKEALIGEIKTTNLIPNAITVIPVGFNEEKTKANIENIIKNKASNGYKVAELSEENKQVFIKANDDSTNELKPNDLIVNSYVFDNQTTELKELKFNLNLTYGKMEYQTTLDTTDNYAIELLKAGGFNFGVYVKKLDDTQMPIDGTKLKAEVKKLMDIFKDESYKTPKDITSSITSAMISKADWKDLNTNPVTLNLESPANKVDKNKSANLLVFASFSQKGMGNNNSLLTPTLTTIHIEKMQENSGK